MFLEAGGVQVLRTGVPRQAQPCEMPMASIQDAGSRQDHMGAPPAPQGARLCPSESFAETREEKQPAAL